MGVGRRIVRSGTVEAAPYDQARHAAVPRRSCGLGYAAPVEQMPLRPAEGNLGMAGLTASTAGKRRARER
ncbi:hypothetical protein ACWHAM_02685 [Paenibacillus terrae]